MKYQLRIGERKVPISYEKSITTDGIRDYIEHKIIVKETKTEYKGNDLQELVEEVIDDISGVLI